jgi:murein DD-endopeptidase MepM/ murein hydrolase activator NlpD
VVVHLSTTRRLVAAILILATMAPTSVVSARPCWPPPVSAPVIDPFREPACRWCAGNRGLEYGTTRGARVRAVATGRVSYSGSITGTGYVVVRHGDGLRTTYGNLAERWFGAGDLVLRGATVGLAAGPVHFGLRDGSRYVDPAPYLGRLVYRTRLVPLGTARATPAPRPVLRCGR